MLVLKWLKCQEGGLNWLVKNLGNLWKLKTTFKDANNIELYTFNRSKTELIDWFY